MIKRYEAIKPVYEAVQYNDNEEELMMFCDRIKNKRRGLFLGNEKINKGDYIVTDTRLNHYQIVREKVFNIFYKELNE